MLWIQNAVYLSNCKYLIMPNATRGIFQTFYRPLNVVITNERSQWTCVLFMPGFATASAFHIWERQFTASLHWEWCSLATVPVLLTARFSVPPNTPWSSCSCTSHSFSISLLGRALPCTHLPLCNFSFTPTRYILLMFHQPTKLLSLTSSLPKHNRKKHQFN